MKVSLFLLSFIFIYNPLFTQEPIVSTPEAI